MARGRPLPTPDAIPDDEPKEIPTAESELMATPSSHVQPHVDSLSVPITSRAQSFNSDNSSNASPLSANFPATGTSAPPTSSSLGSALSRGRAKTIASLTGTSKTSQIEMTPKEVNLPKDDLVNGQPIEAVLYKDAVECPICFLYYPPHLNKTRCCDQAICSECFVQIKRPDPHPPGHVDPSAPVPPSDTGNDGSHDELISEPADCPYCQAPEFGITYEPPSFRRGLAYANQMHPLQNSTSAMSSSTSVASGQSGLATGPPRRRTTSVSANDPVVITTDRVRPDWHQKLAAARAHTARRSAAATALHTAAYLMGNRGYEVDGRSFGSFGRRGLLRRTSGPESPGGNGASQLSMLALMSERYAAQSAVRGDTEGEPSVNPPPRGSSRRGRAEDLEEMMMMEAIRLSLASEEDRQKREEKESKKEAKKKEKENKKAEKAAKKTGSLTSTPNQSSVGLAYGQGETYFEDVPSSPGKGKGLQQGSLDQASDNASMPNATPQSHLERARQQILPNESSTSASPYSSTPRKPSHLRTLSNASSSASSVESIPGSSKLDTRETTSTKVSPQASGINIPGAVSEQGSYLSGTPPGGGAGTEPMFNFSSLAAMVGDDEKKEAAHQDDTKSLQDSSHQRGESSTSAHFNDVNHLEGRIDKLQTTDESLPKIVGTTNETGSITRAQ